jgi:Zn-dependent protease
LRCIANESAFALSWKEHKGLRRIMDNALLVFLLTITAFLLSITLHEFFHALVAYWLGDDTAKRAGRLTLNPFAHIDLLGLLFLILVRVGWAKPVPIEPRNFKYPGFYSILVGLAGPFSNFMLAFISLYAMKYLVLYLPYETLFLFLKEMVALNVMLGLFNILPIPPLDGSHIIAALIPLQWREGYYRLQPIFLILLLMLFTTSLFQEWFLKAVAEVTKLLKMLVI